MDDDLIYMVIAWTSSIIWIIAYSFQVAENYSRKKYNVFGLSIDFVFANPVGFVSYFIYLTIGKISPDSGPGEVLYADLAFGFFCSILTIIIYIQSRIYSRDPSQYVSFTVSVLLGAIIGILFFVFLFTILIPIIELPVYARLIMLLGYTKIACNLIKFIPQLLHNYTRKSTIGLNLEYMILDLSGAIFCAGGMLAFHYLKDLHHKEFNLSKVLLCGVITIFQITFLTQRFCLYPHSQDV